MAESAQDQQAQDGQNEAQDNVLKIEATVSAEDTAFPEEAGEDGERVAGFFNFPVGDNLTEDIEIYGEDTIREMAHRAITVKGQTAVRRELKNGTHPDDLEEQLGGGQWRPDVTHTTKKDPKSTIVSNYNKLGDEEKDELLAMLEESAKG